MKRFAVMVATLARFIIVDDRKIEKEYIFREDLLPFGRGTNLNCTEFNFEAVEPIGEMENPEWHTDNVGTVWFETDVDFLNANTCPLYYDIISFNSFYGALKSLFEHPKKVTNYECITNMGVEDLALFLRNNNFGYHRFPDIESICNWLREESCV